MVLEQLGQGLNLLHVVKPKRFDARVHVGERAANAVRIEGQIGDQGQPRRDGEGAEAPERRSVSRKSRARRKPDACPRHPRYEVESQRVAGGHAPTPGRGLDHEAGERGNEQGEGVSFEMASLFPIEHEPQGDGCADGGVEYQGLQADGEADACGGARQRRSPDLAPLLHRPREGEEEEAHLHIVVIDAPGMILRVEKLEPADQHEGADQHRPTRPPFALAWPISCAAGAQPAGDQQHGEGGGQHP